jgi:hypothetical protein
VVKVLATIAQRPWPLGASAKAIHIFANPLLPSGTSARSPAWCFVCTSFADKKVLHSFLPTLLPQEEDAICQIHTKAG